MELTFSQSQQFRPLPKVIQLLADCKWAYSSHPNSALMGVGCVLRLLYWHGILKHVKKSFLGKYFAMNFLFDTSTDGAATLYIQPYLEYSIHRFIKEWVKVGSICFDLGSNVGYYPLLCSFMGAQVHSFEPNADVVRLQKINLLLNDFQDQVKVNLAAVCDKDGFAYFYCQSSGRSGISSLLKDPLNPGTKYRVTTVKLDTYIKQNKIKKIDFLKIDVEGGENMVFSGAIENLKKGTIKTIIWESNYRSTKQERLDMIENLNNLGYKHYAMDRKLKRVRPWLFGDEDCISIHKSVESEFKKFINSVNKNYAVLEPDNIS